MRDLLVVVPTRGRPASAIRLLEAVLATATEKTDVIFGLDDDDVTVPSLLDYKPIAAWKIGPRRGMAAWTNALIEPLLDDYEAFASLGDDHVPRTPGWDRILLDAALPTGISYGDDTIMRENLPTAPVVSRNIVVALGWLCEPSLSHLCVDNVIKDIGESAGCLTYCSNVIVEHLHWCNMKAAMDKTYMEAGIFSTKHPDWFAYQEWRSERMTQNVQVVKDLLRRTEKRHDD